MAIGTFQEAGSNKTFNQGLFEESAVQKHWLGTPRELSDGRKFIYSRAGTALAAGTLLQGAVELTGHTGSLAITTDVAADADKVPVTIATTAAVKDYYREGYLWVNVTPGIAHSYKIRGHAAYVLVTGLTQDILLFDKIRVALTTAASKVTIRKHPNDGVISTPAATLTGAHAGVAPIAVTDQYYFWSQVKGPACCLITGVVSYAGALVPGAAGTLILNTAALFNAECGFVISYSGSGLPSLVNLSIPGY